MQTLTAIIFLSLISITTFSQPKAKMISGIVKDSKNEVIAGATVRLVMANDSIIMKSVSTNGNGKFEFVRMENGSYVITITAIGQKQYTSQPLTIDDFHRNIVLPGIIMLASKGTQLADVMVKTTRPLIEQEIDKTVVNVGAMISSATSNTLEVLEKTPGVTVGSNGEISLNGRGGVLVLIDGRATYMSGQDLASYLKSLPGSLLDKIELMDNPPARYDAAGNGIINIKFKKTRVAGYTGSISLGYTQGKYGRNNDAISLNYNHKKINIFGTVGYNGERGYSADVYDRRFFDAANQLTSQVILDNNQTYKSNGINLNTGLDFTASANTTVGFLLNINQNQRDGQLNYNSDSYNALRQLDTVGSGSVIGGDKRTNVSANVNFLHKFGKSGKELSGDMNYLQYHNNGDQSLQNFLYKPTGALTANDAFLYLLPSDINIYTLKADYVQPIKNKVKLEAGFKSSIVDNNNVSNYYSIINSGSVIDNSRSNHFRYHENINAAYINVQKTWKRLGAQLGLRLENTLATGRQLGNEIVPATTFTKNYTKAFPSVFVSYKLDSAAKNSVTVSITRRINRPNYQSLNPFTFFRDKYSYSSGNPLLKPQYQDRYEIRFQHKQFLRVGLSYNRFSDVIFQITQPVNDVFISKPDNIAKGYMLLLNTGLNVTPAKWWSLNTDILLSHMGLNGNAFTEKLNPSTFVARINVLNQLKFNKGWSAELGGYYASTDLNGQAFTGAMARANAAFQKKIWKDKASIKIAFDDIFHSWIYHNKSVSLKQAQYFQTIESDTQRIGFAFTWRFGNDTFARKRKYNDNASDDEKGRVN